MATVEKMSPQQLGAATVTVATQRHPFPGIRSDRRIVDDFRFFLEDFPVGTTLHENPPPDAPVMPYVEFVARLSDVTDIRQLHGDVPRAVACVQKAVSDCCCCSPGVFVATCASYGVVPRVGRAKVVVHAVARNCPPAPSPAALARTFAPSVSSAMGRLWPPGGLLGLAEPPPCRLTVYGPSGGMDIMVRAVYSSFSRTPVGTSRLIFPFTGETFWPANLLPPEHPERFVAACMRSNVGMFPGETGAPAAPAAPPHPPPPVRNANARAVLDAVRRMPAPRSFRSRYNRVLLVRALVGTNEEAKAFVSKHLTGRQEAVQALFDLDWHTPCGPHVVSSAQHILDALLCKHGMSNEPVWSSSASPAAAPVHDDNKRLLGPIRTGCGEEHPLSCDHDHVDAEEDDDMFARHRCLPATTVGELPWLANVAVKQEEEEVVVMSEEADVADDVGCYPMHASELTPMQRQSLLSESRRLDPDNVYSASWWVRKGFPEYICTVRSEVDGE